MSQKQMATLHLFFIVRNLVNQTKVRQPMRWTETENGPQHETVIIRMHHCIYITFAYTQYVRMLCICAKLRTNVSLRIVSLKVKYIYVLCMCSTYLFSDIMSDFRGQVYLSQTCYVCPSKCKQFLFMLPFCILFQFFATFLPVHSYCLSSIDSMPHSCTRKKNHMPIYWSYASRKAKANIHKWLECWKWRQLACRR